MKPQKSISLSISVIVTLLLSIIVTPGMAQLQDQEDYKGQYDVILETIYPKYPEVDYGRGDTATLIKRGEYLVKVGDCIACHTNTPAGSAAFAGGLPIETPFGTIYSSNITPDKETGLGNWTEADFIQSMHEGKLPDGRNLFPVFPYVYFSNVTVDDLRAIWAYLQRIPAVNQQNHSLKMPFPLNWRFLQYGWKALFFYPYKSEYTYDPDKSKAWNRGAYLVEGLGHCTMCHTPVNILGAPKRKYYLTGNFIEGFWAPNITSYGLKSATHYEVAEVFATGQLINRAGPVAGPMADVNHNSLSHLTEEDRLAIATYLKSVKSQVPYKIKPVKQQNTLKHGRQVYINVCIACHQKGEAGAPRLGDSANWELRVQTGMEALYRHTINGYNNMPVRGACVTCSDDDITAAVDYLVFSSLTRAQRQQLEEHEMQPTLKYSVADGKKIYQETCAVCHETGALGSPKTGDKEVWQPLIAQNMDVLILNTLRGMDNMPPKGGCKYCSTAEIIAAVKYMVTESTTDEDEDYSLW